MSEEQLDLGDRVKFGGYEHPCFIVGVFDGAALHLDPVMTSDLRKTITGLPSETCDLFRSFKKMAHEDRAFIIARGNAMQLAADDDLTFLQFGN